MFLFYVGNLILRTLSEGKYANEEYEYHLRLSANTLVLLTKSKLFFLKKSVLTSAWDSDWIEHWENCSKVIQERGKLRILLKVRAMAQNKQLENRSEAARIVRTCVRPTQESTMGNQFNSEGDFSLD